ncbi:AAA family ATPase [Deinococcus hohokamensis]|uniref:AAA family ATPase n=1 Tax=Deinococcus hohokamensis TaxID=309883 RepID=A0ABV9I6U3_9DEIO
MITGMSGTGKSSVLAELARRGHRTVDTDEDGWSLWHEPDAGWQWREDRMAALLAEPSEHPLFVSGCHGNQGRFYDRFEAVVLLSAPAEVLLERLRTRTTNPYGKTPEQQAEVLGYLETVEPLLRRSATLELDSSQLDIAALADRLEALIR